MKPEDLQDEDGFTIIEALVSLFILALSFGWIMQSISLASAQIRSAETLSSAQYLALKLLSDPKLWNLENPETFNRDPATNLYWRIRDVRTSIHDQISFPIRVSNLEVTVSTSINTAPIYSLKTARIERDQP